MTGAVPSRITYEEGEPRLEWLIAHGARFTEPFFEDTLARLRWADPANSRERRPRTSLDALRVVSPGAPLAALIFHVSRCGSTLVAQILASLPRHIVASEPPIVDDILRTRERDPRATDEDRIAWLRGAMHSLGQPNRCGGARLFVKLDCWHIFSLPLFRRAFPAVPFVFVFRDPVEVLASALARPGLTFLPETIPSEHLGLTPEARAALSREEYGATVIGRFFQRARDHRAELHPLAYERLPAAVWESFPGCSFTAEEKVLLGAASEGDAKSPGRPFQPDAVAKRQLASPALLAAVELRARPDYIKWLAGE
jgi:sulfotransferase family protein